MGYKSLESTNEGLPSSLSAKAAWSTVDFLRQRSSSDWKASLLPKPAV